MTIDDHYQVIAGWLTVRGVRRSSILEPFSLIPAYLRHISTRRR